MLSGKKIIKMPRSAKDVIEEAIQENKLGEYILYFLAIIVALTGLGSIIFAITQGIWQYAASGSIPTALVWPALIAARTTRKENLAIRLLEPVIDNAETAQEVSIVLLDFFKNIMEKK